MSMDPLSTGDPLRLGPYRLLGVLGEGGMGKVYFGRDDTGSPAAVKVLRPELAHDRQLAQRFVREAQMARAVTSPGVARVLGAQTEGGRPWIATEYLAGPTLDAAVAAHGPLAEPLLRALADALARTLYDIQVAGLVHRDLKPANIVLTSSGPRVIDFGIARPEHGLTLTTTGQIPVTPGYGAPEQILGRRVGPAADVFSLGAVLVYAASGRRAYDASHVAAVQYEVVHGEPDLGGVPQALRELIAPLLAKEPEGRPAPGAVATAFAPPKGAAKGWRSGALAADIRTREGEASRLATVVDGDARRPVNRRKLLIGLAAGGTVLAAGGAGTAWWRAGGTEGTRGVADPFDVPPAVVPKEAALLNADRGDYIIGKAAKPLWGPLPVVAADTPAPVCAGDVVVIGARAGGVTAFDMATGRQRWRAPEAVVRARYLNLSDRLVAVLDAKGTLRTYAAATGEPKWTAAVGGSSLLTADEEAVYLVGGDGKVHAVSRSDARTRWTAPVPFDVGTETVPLGLTGAGRLVVHGAGGDVVALSTADGTKAWERRGQAEEVLRPAFQDGVFYLGGTSLTAVAAKDGARLWSVPAGKDYMGAARTWSSPTAYPGLLFSCRREFPMRVDPRTGKEIWSRGYGNGPVLLAGSGAWVVQTGDHPELNGLDPRTGLTLINDTQGAKEGRWGIAAAANRVFLHDSATLRAVPVF
ncbi:PQQ-binding-like beta-propeller repeat protein [Streptomyces sp. NPDC001941]|uniref:protein kinase domain-containing protein n=1 Tax=Streptomyces sp. NPDC001941 TaxID=3154659 RepID=UPI003329559A